MKVDITKRQLEAIMEIVDISDAMIGGGNGTDIKVNGEIVNTDDDIIAELKHIQKFFNKNGYELNLNI